MVNSGVVYYGPKAALARTFFFASGPLLTLAIAILSLPYLPSWLRVTSIGVLKTTLHLDHALVKESLSWFILLGTIASYVFNLKLDRSYRNRELRNDLYESIVAPFLKKFPEYDLRVVILMARSTLYHNLEPDAQNPQKRRKRYNKKVFDFHWYFPRRISNLFCMSIKQGLCGKIFKDGPGIGQKIAWLRDEPPTDYDPPFNSVQAKLLDQIHLLIVHPIAVPGSDDKVLAFVNLEGTNTETLYALYSLSTDKNDTKMDPHWRTFREEFTLVANQIGSAIRRG